MLCKEKIIELKDGRWAVLRSPMAGDARKLLEYMKTCAAETDFLMRYPEECTDTEDREKAFIAGINDSEYDMMIICKVGEELAGTCQIKFGNRIKIKHRAEVAIAMQKKFWNLGIGTAMLRELTEAAALKGASQMELDFVEGNERARALYEKMGFEAVAEKPGAIKLKDGRILKEISMIKRLRPRERG